MDEPQPPPGLSPAAAAAAALAPDAGRTAVVLVADLVESVRLMEADEAGTVARWRALRDAIEAEVLPRHRGRFVKSTGDGLLAEFGHAPQAAAAAFDMHALAARLGEGVPAERRIVLRIGLHRTALVSDRHDVYGRGVNLAARLAAQAGGGQTWASQALREALVEERDASVEDLGPLHFKHIAQPVPCFRLHPPRACAPTTAGAMRGGATAPAAAAIGEPAVAVLPFDADQPDPEQLTIGELIADGVIAQLARTPRLRALSRLSTRRFAAAARGAPPQLAELAEQLQADYVLSGRVVRRGERLLVQAELADARAARVLWAERLPGSVGDLLEPASELCGRLAQAVGECVLDAQVQLALTRPLPSLQAGTLLVGGISLMHRAAPRDVAAGERVLDHLIERHPRAAQGHAWLAKLLLIRIVAGHSTDARADAARALELTRRALELDPDNALVLAVHGHVLCQTGGEPEAARRALERALAADAHEPLAWMYRSVWRAMWGEDTAAAVADAEHGTLLSPRDPLAYYFAALRASALLADGRAREALALAEQSLRLNARHTPSLRVAAVAQHRLGREDAARASFARLLALDPGFSRESYLARGAGESRTRRQVLEAMQALGVG
jgi:class 3 adenylate cyclase/TolB-like protein/Flp pilus assembly protein TadD